MHQLSVWNVPAITAGTRQDRVFSNTYPGLRPSCWHALQVYNRSSSELLLYLDYEGAPRRIASGDVVIIDDDRCIEKYQMDASGSTAATDVQVNEYVRDAGDA